MSYRTNSSMMMRQRTAAALVGAAIACAANAGQPAGNWQVLLNSGMIPLGVAPTTTEASPARPSLLADLVMMQHCYSGDLTDEERAEVIARWNALPPTLDPNSRYFTDFTVWTGDGLQSSSGRAAAARLTYSFPADGVTWGLDPSFPIGPNTLNARFQTLFGALNVDRGRELVRQAFASWRRFGGLTYDEVADDGVAQNFSTTRVATRGDIRVGGLDFGAQGGGVLAYNFFPSGGGDMCINNSFFTPGNFSSPTNNFRYFRNTMAHEHGHGLGYIHPVPCNNTKLMEPFLSTAFDAVQIDDRRGAGRNYGDRFSGNNSSANARDFGSLTAPALKSIIERNLSLNGTGGVNNSDEDWFRFSLDSNQTLTIIAAPSGGSYENGQQSSGCSGSTSIIDANSAGNLNIEFVASDGTTILQSATALGVGSTETINAGSRPAGTYFVRIFDGGPNSNQIVQLYTLTIRVGASTAAPEAVAGVNKRINANQNCFFMGDIHSTANEGTLSNASFDWDLDGDGTFETLDTPQPSRTYAFGGVVPVTLRLTDSNGQVDTDTINVTVVGPPPAPPGPFNLQSPANGATQLIRLPTLSWSASPFASTYDVEVDDNSDFSSPEFTSTEQLTSVTLTGTPLNAATTYFWRVTAENPLGTILCTPSSFSFTTYTVAPGSPPLLLPANGATNQSLNPNFQWDTANLAETYTIQIDNNSDFSSPESEATTPGTTFQQIASLSPGTTYSWRVLGNNAIGSTPSLVRTFSTVNTPPSSPSLLAPPNGGNVNTLTPTLDWSDAAGAATYRLEVDDNFNFSSLLLSEPGLTSSTYTFGDGVLTNGVRYFWRVFAVNGVGQTVSTPSNSNFLVDFVPPCCRGNADKIRPGAVSFGDVTTILVNFGNTYPDGNGQGDSDCNGSVNFGDITDALNNFNAPCP